MFTRLEALASVATECEAEAVSLPQYNAVGKVVCLPRTHHAEQLMLQSERALNAGNHTEMASLLVLAWDQFNRDRKQAERALFFAEKMLQDCHSSNWDVDSVRRQEAVVQNEENVTKAKQCLARINEYMSSLQDYFINTDEIMMQHGTEMSSDWNRVVREAREWLEVVS
tara:strand:- start:4983 stop:5489 length:507 start_codon:yes stop_codon:yes gene_type:complete